MLQWSQKEKRTENTFENRIAENIPNLEKEIQNLYKMTQTAKHEDIL